MPEFVPVEHDPFNQPSTIESGRFVPVEHDPFAASPSEQPSLVAADFTNLSVDINPAKGEGMNIDTEKLKTAFTDARTITQLSGVSFKPSDAYKYRDIIDAKIKEDSWGKMLSGEVYNVYPAFGVGLGGNIRLAEESLAGGDIGAETRRIIREQELKRASGELPSLSEEYVGPRPYEPYIGEQIAERYSEILKKQQPNVAPQSLKYYAHLIVMNTFVNLPALGVGIATKGRTLPLTIMGLQAGGTKYQQLREGNIPIEESVKGAAIVGVSEAATEFLPTDVLIKEGVPFAKRLLLTSGLDVPGELINTSIESVIDKVTITPNMTLGDYVKALAETAIVSLGSAGLLTTSTHPLIWARDFQSRVETGKKKLSQQNLENKLTEEEKKLTAEFQPETLKEMKKAEPLKEVKEPTHKEIVDSFAELSDEDMAKRIEELIPAPHEALLEPSQLKEPPPSEQKAAPMETGVKPEEVHYAVEPKLAETGITKDVDAWRGLKVEGTKAYIGDIGTGAYWTLDRAESQGYGPNVIKKKLNFENAISWHSPEAQEILKGLNYPEDPRINRPTKEQADALRDKMLEAGHDGLYNLKTAEIVDFRPQPKYEIVEKGTFNGEKIPLVAGEGVLVAFEGGKEVAMVKYREGKVVDSKGEPEAQDFLKSKFEKEAEFKLTPTEMPKAKPKPPVQVDSIKGIQHEMPKTSIKTIEAGDPMLAELTKREEAKRQLAIPETRVIKEKKAIAANPETDSLATYIRKNGGFNYQKEHMKGELDRLSKKEAGTTGLISKSGKGYTLDQMLGKAIEDGYFNENATINDLIDTLENEVYMKKKSWSTMKIWTDEAIGEVMKDGMASEEKRLSSLLADLNDAIGEEGKIGKGGADMSKVMPILSKIGNKIYAEGHKTYEQFSNRMKEISGTAYSKIKDYLYRVWQAVKQFNERLGERGAIGISKEERIALKEKGFSDKQISAMTNEEMNKLFPKREQVRETTGQVKDEELVNLRYAFIKAGQAAREAFRAGKIEVAEQEKQKLVDILDRSKKIKAVMYYFGLTDAEMKKVSRRNPFLMSQYEFKIYLDDVRQKALEMAENSFEKSRIMYHIFNKDLKKVNNYRMALELPPITKMTTEQAAQFADLLEPFQEGDEFLTLRELETVDRTDLAGIRTWREARERLAKETGITVEELNKIKVTEFDKYRWDAVLVERNPFYKMMVTETTKKLLEGNLRIHDVENKVFELARKSQKSKKRSLLERAIPQDKEIIEYLEAPMEDKEAIGKEMTPEQLDYANYIQTYFRNALEYLIKENALEKGRENYFVHIRRSFFENAKEEGLIKAVKDIFKSYQEDMATFQILDKDTGNILPLEKFFQFALHRSGVIEPSANATKAFLTYVKTFEKKISLDEIIPKIDIYAQSLTPQRLTPRGLEKDKSIKTFVNEYINNKKGRRIDQMVGKQGGVIDVGIRAAKTFTTLLDLGLNIPVGLTSYVGESVTNFISLGIKKHALGAIRDKTKKGRAIVKKYEAWTDRSIWENFKAPGKEIQERFSDALFGLFHQSMVDANRHFLLGSLTKEEWNSGELNSKRLAELQLEMGRWRVVPGTKSLVGSTALGSAAMQYKTWAAPIISTTVKDVSTLITDLKSKSVGEALTTREAREIYRIIGITSTMLVAGAMVTADDDDKSFIGQLLSKAYRESLTLLQGVDPSLWLATPRILGFLTELGKNLHVLILLEEYKAGKKKGELKGVKGLEKQITPRAIKQFQEKTIGNNQLPPKR